MSAARSLALSAVLALSLIAPASAQPAWTMTGPMSTPRMQHTATLLADGRVLVTGGRPEEHTGSALASAEVFDPETGTWASVSDMSAVREAHSATRLEDGRVLVVGDATAELFDPATDAFHAAAPPAEPRRSHVAVHLGGARVLVAGGVSHPLARASVEIYDADADAWSFAPSMRVERWNHSVSRLPDGRLMVVGGSRFVPDGTERVTTTELFDPETETWSLAGPLRQGRAAHAAAALPTGEVVVVGGDGGWDATTFEIYDPVRDRFVEEDGDPGVGPALARAIALESGVALVLGGERGDASATRLYLPWQRGFVTGPTLTRGRREHTATLLDDGRVLVVGGIGGLGTSRPEATAELLALEAIGGACTRAGDCASGVCEDGACAATPALPEPPIDAGGGGTGGTDAGVVDGGVDAGGIVVEDEEGGGCAIAAHRRGSTAPRLAWLSALLVCRARRRRAR